MNLYFCWTLRLFYLTLSDAMQFVEIVQILQISTTRTSMATNLSSKLVIPECCSVTEHKLYQKLPRILLIFCVNGDDVFPESANFTTNFVKNSKISHHAKISHTKVSCEQSFSKLKLILSYLRGSLRQDRLSDLALLRFERETTDFDTVIDQFATVKSRK